MYTNWSAQAGFNLEEVYMNGKAVAGIDVTTIKPASKYRGYLIANPVILLAVSLSE